MISARKFLDELKHEVEQHPGVRHPFLSEAASGNFTRDDFRIFGQQHFALVGLFTRYLENCLTLTDDSESKMWIAKVLIDEYGEGSDGKDHATLYQNFLRHCGIPQQQEWQTNLHPNVRGFIETHMQLTTREAFLVGLGAVGPGHEWSIPHMFPPLVAGLRKAGFSEGEILYFTLHLEQDEDHGAWLEEALLRKADSQEAQEQIRQGTFKSLEARANFWSGVQEKITQRHEQSNHESEESLRDLRIRLGFDHQGTLKRQAAL